MNDRKWAYPNKPAREQTPYFSGAWETAGTPDLAMGTDDIDNKITRTVSSQVGGSDHVQIIHEINLTENQVTPNIAPSWNFKLKLVPGNT